MDRLCEHHPGVPLSQQHHMLEVQPCRFCSLVLKCSCTFIGCTPKRLQLVSHQGLVVNQGNKPWNPITPVSWHVSYQIHPAAERQLGPLRRPFTPDTMTGAPEPHIRLQEACSSSPNSEVDSPDWRQDAVNAQQQCLHPLCSSRRKEKLPCA